jgi:hypothetical protein
LEGIGWYAASATPEGKKWGLNGWWVGLGWVSPEQITSVLARDENGNAAAWVKNYGRPDGTGLVQLFMPRGTVVDKHRLRDIAEYGLWR